MARKPKEYKVTFIHILNGKEVSREEIIKYIAQKYGKKSEY